MEDVAPRRLPSDEQEARFALTLPRRFVLPAVLLLLSEGPSHGYVLQKDLQAFGIAHIDRPTTYRALAQLESDGLVESWSAPAKAGQQRHVYGITAPGLQVLAVWMDVVRQERAALGRVLRRYRASAATSAVVDEIDEQWAAALDFAWAPVLATSPRPRRLASVDAIAPRPNGGGGRGDDEPTGGARSTTSRTMRLVPERSVVLIEVRSTVGPLSFGVLGLTGSIEADEVGGSLSVGPTPSARVEIAIDGLRSGNHLYDAELLRRIDARRFPNATLELHACEQAGADDRYRVAGQLTFHGVAKEIRGTVHVARGPEGGLVVTGEQVFDIRDFDVPCPTVLMLRFYPDVRVRLHVEAEPAAE